MTVDKIAVCSCCSKVKPIEQFYLQTTCGVPKPVSSCKECIKQKRAAMKQRKAG